MSSQPLTIKQLRARFNKEKPKYIGLQNDRGQWPVAMNPPAMKAEVRMKQIEAYFEKESTPDGIYFFVQKENIGTNAPELATPVAKGDISKLPVISEPAKQTIQMTATKDVWDLKTALDKETQIISLTMQVQFLTNENADLRRQIKELEEMELAEGEDSEKSDTKEMMEGFKSIMETFTPVIDKSLEIWEKSVDNKRQSIQGNGIAPQRILRETRQEQNTASSRTDGGVPCEDPDYERFFAWISDEGTEEQFEAECRYLESVNPDMYKEFAVKFDIDDEDGS